MQLILQWLDLIWVALGLLCARKDQRPWVIGSFVANMIMMRLLVELVDSTGFPNGYLGILDYPALNKGLIVYSLFYAFFLVWVLFSPYAKGTILMGVSISLFFSGFIAATLIMAL